MVEELRLYLFWGLKSAKNKIQTQRSDHRTTTSAKVPTSPSLPPSLLPPLPNLRKDPKMIIASPRSFSFGSVCHRTLKPIHNKIVPPTSMSNAARVVLRGGGPRPGRRR